MFTKNVSADCKIGTFWFSPIVENFKTERRFRKNSVVAIETFITTASTLAIEQPDGFTFLGNKGGFAVQHEHTIVVTNGKPLVLTEMNGIWD